jgi:S-adenosyl methyltransferase
VCLGLQRAYYPGDYDPIVLAHARALLTSDPQGACAYVDADLHDPARILADPATRATLDFSQPIALILVAVLHFVPDEDDPAGIVSELTSALPPGSYVAASHASGEHFPDGLAGAGRVYRDRGLRGALRTAAEFTELVFPGLDLVDPGVVLVSEWRADPGLPRPLPAEVNTYGGVARKG